MKVPADELRERYSRLETEQLLVILAAPKSHYTAEAREVAARILADRRFEKPTPPPPRPTARERETAGWWAAAAATALFGAHLANHIFKAVKDAGVDGDVLTSPA